MQRLETIGMPKAQQSDLCALSLLAMAGLKPKDEWKNASNEWIRIHDIIAFVNENYGATYAENSRETFRKQAMHRFRTAALIEDNGKATNSPNYRYRITEETLKVLQSINTSKDEQMLERFLKYHEKLVDIYASNQEKARAQIDAINGIKGLISKDVLKTMQLLGFNYKAAIGEPLTELCANKIKGVVNSSQRKKR